MVVVPTKTRKHKEICTLVHSGRQCVVVSSPPWQTRLILRKQIPYGHNRCQRAEGCIAMDGRHVKWRQVENLLWTSVGLLVAESMRFRAHVYWSYFFHVVICTTPSHNIGHLFLATMNKCTELRKYAFPDSCSLDFFSGFGGYYHLSNYLILIF